ncbi:MAG TPA: Rid family detoxifying hydrolase [Thermoanaerobaculia bacterium]|nr:Rid family detoxifying hydrolase [Thermoanaerobaculia bacterium]
MIVNAFIAAGQPHIYLAPDRNLGWARLRQAYEEAGRQIAQSGAELMLVYSTQWFSVIGHLFQIDPQPKWTLVDQNWYEFGEIPYEFRIDPEFGKLYSAIAKEHGLQTSTVSYRGFPIDTGTVVALKLLNPGNAIPASVVSCNIYAEREETRILGRAARKAIDQYGKKTVVVCVTNLSNRYEVAEIDPEHDRISSAKDDEWNRKVLEMLGEGRLEDVAQVAREFGREANADMGFKAIWWLAALMGEDNRYDGRVHEYQPVWGTGCALVELTPNPSKEIEWEKEFDEEPVGAAESGGGTGLETHNVLAEGPRVHSASEMSSHEEVDVAAPARARTFNVARAPAPVGPYPHAKRVGEWLFLSGIGPRTPGTNEIPQGIEAQTRACIENIRTILEEAGSSLEKVFDVTVYLTNMKRDFDRFNKVYAEYFGRIQPTRTTVGVDSLPTPIDVELKVIASP